MSNTTNSQEQPLVLVVDDTSDNLVLLSELLSDLYRIKVANNGEKALKIANSTTPPDLILLDIMMPGIDGYEVCRQLKASPNTKDIPVIFLTAKSEMGDEEKGLELGAVDYITKPIIPSIVLVRVRTHLALYQKNLDLERMVVDLRSLSHQLGIRNRLIRKTLGSYLSDEVVNQILNTPEGLELGGENLEVTVLTSDLRGFTCICEQIAPEDVVKMINIYLSEMSEIIFKYNGTIIEFAGDGILAIFGAPVQREDDALRAVACALEMQLAINRVNQLNQQAGYPPVAMGIGLQTGMVIVGNIGSERRKKYSVVGKNVNMAFRIESFTVGGQVLISDSTLAACGDTLRIDSKMEVMPKGVFHPITIYDIGGISGPYSVELPMRSPLEISPLPVSAPVFLSILEGKNAGLADHPGLLLAMGDGIGLFQSKHPVKEMDNIKISLVGSTGEHAIQGILGKVIEIRANGPHLFVVNFSFLPPEAHDWFASLKRGEDGCPNLSKTSTPMIA